MFDSKEPSLVAANFNNRDKKSKKIEKHQKSLELLLQFWKNAKICQSWKITNKSNTQKMPAKQNVAFFWDLSADKQVKNNWNHRRDGPHP